MDKLKEFYRNITKTGWIIISAVIALILIVILVNSLSAKGENSQLEAGENNESLVQDEQYNTSSGDSVLSVEDVLKGDYKNDYESATVFVQNSREVSVAVYFDDEKAERDEDEEMVCGKLTFVTLRLPKSPSVINDTITAIFENKVVTDFEPGNIIPEDHPNLKFDNATLENGIARVYLKGEFSSEDSDNCGVGMVLTQISETIMKFEGVKDVEIYQNLQKIN